MNYEVHYFRFTNIRNNITHLILDQSIKYPIYKRRKSMRISLNRKPDFPLWYIFPHSLDSRLIRIIYYINTHYKYILKIPLADKYLSTGGEYTCRYV